MRSNLFCCRIISKAGFYSILVYSFFYPFRTGNADQIFNFFYLFIISIIDKISSPSTILKIPTLNFWKFEKSISIKCCTLFSSGTLKSPSKCFTIGISLICTSEITNFRNFFIIKILYTNFSVRSSLSNKSILIKKLSWKANSCLTKINTTIV